MSQHTAQYPTIRIDPLKVQVVMACDQADALPWWAFKRRQGWITTGRGLKRLSELRAAA
jgi:hypothetical protein